MHEFLGKTVSGPCTINAGCITTKPQTIEEIIWKNRLYGFGTTKGISLQPRPGCGDPIIGQIGPSAFINAVGLRNVGAYESAELLSKINVPEDKALVAQIFGESPEECRRTAEILLSYVSAFEINFSCGHTKIGGIVGKDLNLVERIVRVVADLGKDVIVKPLTERIEECIRRTEKAGAKGYTLINTIGPQPYTVDGHNVLYNKVGGVSGKAIMEKALETVREARNVTKLHITAAGGIGTADDIRDAFMAGANSVGLGTRLEGLSTATIAEHSKTLYDDLLNGTNLAASLLRETMMMEYHKFTVTAKKNLDENMFTLEFDKGIDAGAGQFVFAWLPGIGEKPFSVYDSQPLRLLLNVRGKCTRALSSLSAEKSVYIRGPYGEIPDVGGKVLLVGGGSGIAGLHLFASREGISAVLGGKNKKQLSMAKDFNCDKMHITTEDGSLGRKGLVTDVLDLAIEQTKPDYIINCGPSAMVYRCIEIESRYIPLERILSSIEFLTRCGVGLCGECATSRGYRNCVDGTFLTPDRL